MLFAEEATTTPAQASRPGERDLAGAFVFPYDIATTKAVRIAATITSTATTTVTMILIRR
ncbi:MAG: hypothetical protein QOE54_7209 [Streptosporangiaceae bacterium]|nr:hypothetical protein [Streptosporangiaceae bacterium]MDX6434843.1 hypothetical protein [Streptosporangiaceae bacterium]